MTFVRCSGGSPSSTGSRRSVGSSHDRVGGVVGSHARDHVGHFLIGSEGEELRLLSLIQLLEHVRLELRVVVHLAQDVDALGVGGVLEHVGDIGRLEPTQPRLRMRCDVT